MPGYRPADITLGSVMFRFVKNNYYDLISMRQHTLITGHSGTCAPSPSRGPLCIPRYHIKDRNVKYTYLPALVHCLANVGDVAKQ